MIIFSCFDGLPTPGHALSIFLGSRTTHYLSIPFPIHTIVSFLNCSVQTAPACFSKRLHSNTISHRRLKVFSHCQIGFVYERSAPSGSGNHAHHRCKISIVRHLYQHLRSVFSISSFPPSPPSPTISHHLPHVLGPCDVSSVARLLGKKLLSGRLRGRGKGGTRVCLPTTV